MAPLIGVKVVPAFVETSHCTVGLGEPVAAAVKLAVPPEVMVTLDGFDVTTGAVVTVRVSGRGGGGSDRVGEDSLVLVTVLITAVVNE